MVINMDETKLREILREEIRAAFRDVGLADKDGALPAVTLNGMKRSGKKLVIDPAKLASYARKPVLSPKIDLNSLTEAEKQSLINLVRSR